MSLNRSDNNFLFDEDDYLNFINYTNINIDIDFNTNISTYNTNIENSSVSIENYGTNITSHISPIDNTIKAKTVESNKFLTGDMISVNPNNLSFDSDQLKNKTLKRKPDVDLTLDDENVSPDQQKRERHKEASRRCRENKKNLILDLENQNVGLKNKVDELNLEIEFLKKERDSWKEIAIHNQNQLQKNLSIEQSVNQHTAYIGTLNTVNLPKLTNLYHSSNPSLLFNANANANANSVAAARPSIFNPSNFNK